MNGFDRHGITHLSPSSVNLWINCPSLWVAEKLFGKRGASSAAMHRGNAAEAGVAHALGGMDLEPATALALEQFDRAVMIGDDRSEKERAGIPGMIEHAVAILAPLGTPEPADNDRGQHKVKLVCKGDGWSIPVIGFLDFKYPDAVVDLKTTNRIPSIMTAEHVLQRCIYQRAVGNRAVSFVYASAKKAVTLNDGDVSDALSRFKFHATRMERMLRDRDREEIAAIIPVQDASFYWSGNEAIRREVFGH